MDLTGFGSIADLIKDGLDKIFPDPAAKAAAQLQLLQLQQQGVFKEIDSQLAMAQSQNTVNAAEAATGSTFVGGWRPFIGWVCGSAFGINFVIGPLAEWATALHGTPVHFPKMDMTDMMPILIGMLGLGAMRSYDKVQGTTNGH